MSAIFIQGGLLRRAIPLLLLLTLAAMSFVLPESWVKTVDLAGYAVCHRIPARTFFVADTPLPVCARDTGMFLSAALGVSALSLVHRYRVGWYPGGKFLALFALCFGAWGFDGFNSYLLLLRGEVFFYAPSNLLRLITGALMGITVAAFATPLFNSGLFRDAVEQPSVSRTSEFALLLICGAVVCAVVLSSAPWLYRPLVVLSSASVLGLLGLANALLIAIVVKRHATLQRIWDILPYAVAGLAFAVAEVSLIVYLRLRYLPSLPFTE